MTSITSAAVVLTVSATATRMTAAIVAPTCGIRSSNPVITASTIGNGSPSAQAESPATVAATIEIATLPTSDEETARIDSSSTGRQRCSTAGGVNPNSQSVIAGRSIRRKSARNPSVTSESDRAEHPARDAEQRVRRVRQPGGQILERLADLVVDAGRGDEVLERRRCW